MGASHASIFACLSPNEQLFNKSTYILDLSSLPSDFQKAWSEVCGTTDFILDASAVHAVPHEPQKRRDQGICEEAVTRAWVYEIHENELDTSWKPGSAWKSDRRITSERLLSPDSYLPNESPKFFAKKRS